MDELIHYAVHERVATLTLNRPDKRNALNSALVTALRAALDAAAADAAVRVIVLTGAGKVFSAGADLAALDLVDAEDLALGDFDRAALARRDDELGDRRRGHFLGLVDQPCAEISNTTPFGSLYFASAWRPGMPSGNLVKYAPPLSSIALAVSSSSSTRKPK